MARIVFLGLLVVALGREAEARAQDSEVIALARALRSSVDVASGREPVRHCRQGVRGWERCDERLEAFAAAFVASGRRHRVPPVVLAAIAVGESGLNPEATGRAGEIGIMQLHPRGVGRSLARATCSSSRVDACQAAVVELAAEHLAAWRARCSSDLEALGGYNRGRCGSTPYAERVVSRARRIAERIAERMGAARGGA